MDIRLIVRYTGILVWFGLIMQFAWRGQTLLTQRPPDVGYGLIFLGIATVLFLLLIRLTCYYHHQQPPRRDFFPLRCLLHKTTTTIMTIRLARLGGMLFMMGGVVSGAESFWLHQQHDMLAWSVRAWGMGIGMFLVGAWLMDYAYQQDQLKRQHQQPQGGDHSSRQQERISPRLAAAAPPYPHTSPYPFWEIGLIITITLIGFFLRQVFLADIPHNLSGDEAEMGMTARAVIAGDLTDPFVTSWLSHPNVWFFLQSFSLRLFGNDVAGLRMLSVLFGTATIPALYWLARPFFGQAAALVSAALLASNHFHLHYSRNALNNIADPLLGVIGFAALLRGMYSRRLLPFALTGVALGVAQHFYMGARLLPLLLVVFVFHQMLFHPVRFIRVRWHFALVGIGFLLGIGPLLIFFLTNPSDFNARLNLVGIFQSTWFISQLEKGLTTQQIFLEQIKGGLGAFTFVPDCSAQYDPAIALLDPYSAILFLFGVGVLLLRWKHGESVLLLSWLFGTATLGGVLLANAPASPRYVTTAPIFCLVAAVALVEFVKVLPQLLPMSRWVVHGLAVAVVVFLAVWNSHFYFNTYTPRNVFGWINVEVGTELGHYLARQPDSDEVYVYFFGTPRMYYGFGTTRFLAPRVAGIDMHDPLVGPGQIPPLPHGKRPLFVFLPERQGELAAVRQRYPDGDLYRVPRYTHRDEVLFVSYEPDMGQ